MVTIHRRTHTVGFYAEFRVHPEEALNRSVAKREKENAKALFYPRGIQVFHFLHLPQYAKRNVVALNCVGSATDLSHYLPIAKIVLFNQLCNKLRFLWWRPLLNPGDVSKPKKGIDF